MGDEMILMDTDGRIVFVNDATVQGSGYPRAELVNQPVFEFFREKISLAQFRKKYISVLKKEQRPVSFHVDRVTKKGRVQTLDSTAVLMAYQGKEYALSVARDITRQLMMQEQLKEMADFYHLLSEEAGDPILIVDKKGVITYANQAAEHFFKTDKNQVAGKIFETFVAADSLSSLKDYAQRAFRSPSKFTFEMDCVDVKGNPIPVEVSLSSVVKEGEIVAVHAIVRDRSPQHELEQLVIESEKMQAVQYFVMGTAQELKHPLRGVLKSTQALLEKYKERDFEYLSFREFKDIMKILENVNKRVKYCYDTTTQLENMSKRKVKIQDDYCYVPAVVEDILKLREAELRAANIITKCRMPEQLPPIAMGPIEFNQVVSNLINNAIEAMPGGGFFSIQAAYFKAGRQVRIDVKDEGVGIDPDILPHIFEPFYTTKQRGVEKHTGLGLSIVYNLMTDCHGKIQVHSSRGAGTTIKLLFPVHENRRQRPRA